ncbi:hypothetical protein ACKQTC_09190 [Peptococcus simiae]|uniref:Uncharacterized protein n=2 Tax=Peptococcus simiae TaxID=1643805 RepID=A0ABW9H127_9FIRM
MNKNEAMKSVYEALPILQEINRLYFKARSIEQQASVATVKTQRSKARISWIPAIIAAFIVFYILDIFFELFVAGRSGYVVPIFIISSLILCFVIYKFIRKSLNFNPNAPNKRLSAARNEIDLISDQIFRLASENSKILEKIPRDYRNYEAVSYFEKLFANGQADSMKEAVNLFDEYAHRSKMESNTERSLMIARQQSLMLQNIEFNSARAADAASVGAFFSVLNYLK